MTAKSALIRLQGVRTGACASTWSPLATPPY